MNGDSQGFINALVFNKTDLLKKIPKSDLHSHALLASRFSSFCREMQVSLPPPPEFMNDISEMNKYIIDNLRNIILTEDGFQKALMLAFLQAEEDGITKLEMSIDAMFLSLYSFDIEKFIGVIDQIYKNSTVNVRFNPEIGISRNLEISEAEKYVVPCIESSYFKSIDIYGDELFRDAKEYKKIFRLAKKNGMKLKCHSGEFGDAESVRYTVETLELDEVQHGISASESTEVMKWLMENKIQLNICPTSNLRLKRVKNLETHPARILFDNGVRITINSDDIMIFNQSVSDEFLNLYHAKLFSPEELDIIRLNGLNEK